jgi:hypothetical protein
MSEEKPDGPIDDNGPSSIIQWILVRLFILEIRSEIALKVLEDNNLLEDFDKQFDIYEKELRPKYLEALSPFLKKNEP